MRAHSRHGRNKALRIALRVSVLAGVATAALASNADAQMTDATIYRTQVNNQTGATTTNVNGYYFASFFNETNLNDFVSGTVNVPAGGGSYAMTQQPGTPPYWSYSSPFYGALTDFNAAFPTGAYVLQGVDSLSNTVSVTLNTGAPPSRDYPGAPTLTSSSFDGLAGLNPNAAYTFSYDPFTTTGGTDFQHVFLDVYDVTTFADVYHSDGPLSDTSFTVPAGTFNPNTSYYAELTITSRDEISPPSCNVGGVGLCPALGEVGWDTRTDAFFTTGGAVPEPATWATMLTGFLCLAGLRYRARRARIFRDDAFSLN